MPFNGVGVFLRVMNWQNDAASGIKIRADRHDQEDNNLANGLTQCITRDGQSTPIANLPMGGYNHTNVSDAISRNQYASAGQVQDGGLVAATDTGTANNYILSLSPPISSYVTNSFFVFRPNNTNTGASTVNINSLGVKSIKVGAADVLSGQLTSGLTYLIQYDGTNFQLITASVASILDGSITESKLAANSVSVTKIVDLSVNGNKIANSSITFNKLHSSILATAAAQFTAAGTSIIGTAAGIFDYVTTYVPSYVSTFINGQSWTSQTGSRAVNTSYTNSTGRPIQIAVFGFVGNASTRVQIVVGGQLISGMSSTGWPSNSRQTLYATVPNGSTYQVQVTTGAFTVEDWSELR